MLEKLVLNQKLWLKMAYDICKDKDYAQDLVQDMYVKLHNIDKEINNNYVYFTLRGLFIDNIRKNKEDAYLEFPLLESDDIDLDKHIQQNNKIEVLQSEINCLKMPYKVIIIESTTNGVRQFSRDSGISTRTILKCKKKLKEKVEKKLKESEILCQQLPMHLELTRAKDANNEKIG